MPLDRGGVRPQRRRAHRPPRARPPCYHRRMVTQEERTELLTLYEADRRFNEIDRRFTAADQRFQSIDNQLIDLRQGQRELDKKIDTRISELDRKFNELDQKMERKFHELDQKIERKAGELDTKIAALDTKIAALDTKFERRFETIEGKIDALGDRISFAEDRLRREQRWLFGITLTIMLALFGVVIALVV